MDPFWIALLGAVFFIPFLGQVHLFDWDEVNFAECAREMLVTGDFWTVQIHFQPFWEKPPLFFWMQALSMKVFGVNEFAARFPNALCGIITLVVLYRMGNRLADRRFAWLWTLAYFGSLLPHLYFKSGIIDPWFNLFIFSGFWLFIQSSEAEKNPWSGWIFSGLLLGLAFMTKGPVGFLLPGLAILAMWIIRRFRGLPSLSSLVVFALAALLPAALWLLGQVIFVGPEIVWEFIRYQYRLFSTPDAGHGGFPGYHVVVLLVGCFPASVFALTAFVKKQVTGAPASLLRMRPWMLALFWVVLILFSVVQSKIVHYSSLAYFPLTFLAALGIQRIAFITRFAWYLISGALTGALLAMSQIGASLQRYQDFFPKLDPFAQASLEARVHWSGWEWIPGLCMFSVGIAGAWVLQKKLYGKIWLLFLTTALVIQISLITFIKRVEGYSQRAAIEFFQSLRGQEAYVMTMGYKSYAHLFYADQQPWGDERRFDANWILNGDLDRDAYVAVKVHKTARFEGKTGWREIGRKNGFVFFHKPAATR